MDYISREAAISEFERCGAVFVYSKKVCKAIISRLNVIPAADVVEVVHGEWIEWWPGDCAVVMTGEEMLWECSRCTAKYAKRSNHCPNCGAKMDGGDHDA